MSGCGVGSARHRRRVRPRGMVTVEIAIGLMAVAFLLVLAMWGVSLLLVRGQCGEAAYEAARYLARGDVESAQTASRIAPSGARLAVGGDGVVRCEVGRSIFGYGQILISVEASVSKEP